MSESLINWFGTHLGGVVSKELLVLIVSMFPMELIWYMLNCRQDEFRLGISQE